MASNIKRGTNYIGIDTRNDIDRMLSLLQGKALKGYKNDEDDNISDDAYAYSFSPDEDAVIGVKGRYVYVEICGYVFNEESEEITDDIEVFPAVLKISMTEYQKMFKLWLLGKRKICDAYGHFCGVFGCFYVQQYMKVGTLELTRLDEDEDPDSENFLYPEPVPVIKVLKWNLTPDFEHG